MNCQFCGAENFETAVYCSNCGKRLDGKTSCPTCGALCEEGALYCSACGTRLDGKNVCPQCGTAFEGNFCPSCGAAADGNKRKNASAGTSTWKKILKLVGESLAAAAALVGLIFTFVIGCKVAFPGNENTLNSFASLLPNATTEIDHWYFFGKVYTEIEETIARLIRYSDQISDFAQINLYTYAVFGTVTSALTLISVCVLSLLTAVRFTRHLTGKTEKSAGPLACATYAAFLAGALTMRGLYGVIIDAQMRYSTMSESVTGGLVFNSATVAGIVLGGIFTGAYLICTIVSRGRELREKGTVLNIAFAAVGLVFACLVLAFAGMAPGGITLTDSTSTGSSTLSIRLSFPTMLQVIAGRFYRLPYDGSADATYFLCTFAALIGIVVVALAGANFALLLQSTEKKRAPIAVPVALAVFCAIYLVLTIVATEFFVENVLASELTGSEFVKTYAPAIVTLVFGVLSCILAGVRRALTKDEQ